MARSRPGMRGGFQRVWTTGLAIDRATVIADQLGLPAMALRRSHHIACLTAFLEEPARAGVHSGLHLRSERPDGGAS